MKPTSKVIQMSATSSHVHFLCEDGSSWSYCPETNKWECILEKSRHTTAWQKAEDIEAMAKSLKDRGFEFFKIQASNEEFDDAPKMLTE